MGHSAVGISDPNNASVTAKVLTDSEADSGQPALAVRVISQNGVSGGGAITVADGADVAEGATTDAANTTGTTGTISGKLRGIVTLLANVLQVGGNVASGVSDTGNPVKVGGVFNTALPTITNGQRADAQMSPDGTMVVSTGGSTTGDGVSAPVALFSTHNSASLKVVGSGMFALNPAGTWDRQRMNATAALIAAGTTSTQTNVSLTTFNARGLLLQVQIASGAGTVAVAINGVTASGFTYNILTSTALVGVGGTQLRVFPGATATTNLVANDIIPRSIQVTATVVGTISYGIDYVLTV